MSNAKFMRDSHLWLTVKLFSLLVQYFATWHVFNREFAERSQLERTVLAVCIFFLIDILFIAASHFVESPEVRTLDKIPFLTINILLAFFIMYIGIQNERSFLALAPRIGIIGIVVADCMYFTSEVIENYFSWETVEQRIRNKQKKARRNEDYESWKKARKQIAEERIALAVERERRTLGLLNDKKEDQVPLSKDEWLEVEPGIFLLSEDQYAWVDKQGVYHDLTSTGKPYSLRGAVVARKRSTNNGHLSEKVQKSN